MSDIAQRVKLPTASQYQIDIFSFIEKQISNYQQGLPVKNLMVRAVAGSGKTTTIIHASRLIPRGMKAIFLAFNRDIARELDTKLPTNVMAKTLNSLGWGICKRYVDTISGRTVDFNTFTEKFKTHKIIRDLYTKKAVKNYGKDIRFLVSMCQNLGVAPTGYEDVRSLNGWDDSDASLGKILRMYDHYIVPDYRYKIFNMTREVLVESLDRINNDYVVNYNEQKWFPVIYRSEDGSRLPPTTRYDIIFVDEVQDVNAVDMELIRMVMKKNSIIVSVGDRRQAIYSFRGADTKATEKFKQMFNAEELPLSVSYRCGTNIIKHAREIFSEIEPAPGALEGEILALENYEAGIFEPNDMIICRNNAPIVNFAFALIAKRIAVFVKGRDIGKNLIGIIESLDATDVVDLNAKLNTWYDKQYAMILDDNPDDEDGMQRLMDKYKTIKVFTQHNGDGRVSSIIKEIAELFSTNTEEKNDNRLMRDKVILSTIHKAKGLEADTIFFLDSHLMMPGWIKPGSWQEEQEANLEYVARTRAKHSLVYITSEGLVEDCPDDTKLTTIEEVIGEQQHA